ncbi:hypothetical protein CAC02_08105 [Streptococcus gallolyticus]|uniref:Uncharacterized protein n=1 Tax=Streptococcus gallolyticus TaxID=315405 RepID=A0A368UC36_9STRE|nr:hypothetical protein CAC02_08105 [Streptococcus gallolyticus]
MKDLFIGLGKISFGNYLLLSLISLAPLIHIFIIKTELNPLRIFLTFIGILFAITLFFSRVYARGKE